MGVDLRRLMDPKTAVAKATEALGSQDAGPIAELASAILIREGLVAVAKVLSNEGTPPGD